MAFQRPFALLHLPSAVRTTICTRCRQTRRLHRLNAPVLPTPKQTPFVPDVQTFLTLIGRGLSSHAAKIPSWEALFSLSGQQLKEAGVEPARARRYLLWWRERFRNGIVGIGADLEHVKDGVGELRVVEVPSDKPWDQMATLTKDPGMRKVIINAPPSLSTENEEQHVDEDGKPTPLAKAPPPRFKSAANVKPVVGMKIVKGSDISGTGVQMVKGHQGVARLKVVEGLWEQRRGHKVDGGERRKAMVRAKRAVQERKMAR